MAWWLPHRLRPSRLLPRFILSRLYLFSLYRPNWNGEGTVILGDFVVMLASDGSEKAHGMVLQ